MMDKKELMHCAKKLFFNQNPPKLKTEMVSSSVCMKHRVSFTFCFQGGGLGLIRIPSIIYSKPR